MRISVCMATYNGERYLQRQLDSILSQLGGNDEIIISDDSSTDRTVELIKGYRDPRIRLIEGGAFKSPIFNLENALKRASGQFIFLADQDDVWLPGRVSHALYRLERFDIVVCNSYIVDGDEKLIHESYFDWKGCGPGFFRNLKKNSYLGCSLAFNRKIRDFVLPFPGKIAMHDIWIGMVSELIGKTYFMPQPMFLYRRHEHNFTAAIHKADDQLSDFKLGYKIWYRVEILYYLMIRYFKRRI
ncbi:MAG: glycosyltransferase family 2 protein, partial [Bacteroidota bacterium]|nr:glycosyltransferase family 2 protein [Bacteroidota bacterium]